VSDKESKPPPLEASSSLSASGLPSTDQSLERVLGAIGKTIESFTVVAKMIYSEVTKQGHLNMQRHEMAVKLLGKMRLELASLADQLNTLSASQNIHLGATVEARQALDRTREKLEAAADDMKEVTGQHQLLNPEDEEGKAPRPLRVLAVWVTNFGWAHKAKVVGWAGIAAVAAKHAWDVISPYFPWMH
jgi:hypothetical protein